MHLSKYFTKCKKFLVGLKGKSILELDMENASYAMLEESLTGNASSYLVMLWHKHRQVCH